MRIIHMADSHLGFSAYNKVDQWGRNLVEERVYRGFTQAIDKIIEIHPDVVIHAGDVFHHVRPRIRTLYIFKRELERLNEAKIHTIIISGNHDAPKTSSTFSPFALFEGLDYIHIVHEDNEYKGISIGNYVFHCIPFCLDKEAYLEEFRKIKPTGADVLVMHGLIESIKDRRLRTVGEHELSDSFLKSYFSYIALGHFHHQGPVAKNAWYSGSIEYFNFGEASDTKGILLVDLESGKVDQIEVGSKYMFDYPPIDCTGLSSSEIKEELLALFDKEVIKDNIIRINLKNVTKEAFKSIDQSKIMRLGSSALHFKIKVGYVDENDEDSLQLDSKKLDEEFSKFLEEESSANSIPKLLKDDIIFYGTSVLRKAIAMHNSGTLNASD
jgi:DNA repair exonuclease SbcCD nuclease subunit